MIAEIPHASIINTLEKNIWISKAITWWDDYEIWFPLTYVDTVIIIGFIHLNLICYLKVYSPKYVSNIDLIGDQGQFN